MCVLTIKSKPFIKGLRPMVARMRADSKVATQHGFCLDLAGVDQITSDTLPSAVRLDEQVMNVHPPPSELKADQTAHRGISDQMTARLSDKDMHPRIFTKKVSHKIVRFQCRDIAVMGGQFTDHLDDPPHIRRTGVTDHSETSRQG